MAVQIKFDQLPAQKIFFGDESTKDLIFSGGLGSGKTYSLCMKGIRLSQINRNMPGGFLCPTYGDFKRDVRPEMEGILDAHKIRYRYHGSDKAFYFPWTRAPLYVFSGEKPIAGPNLAYCLINEFSLIKYERIKEMLRRVRLKKARLLQKCMAGTPEDIHGWLEDHIEKMENRGNFKIVYADTSENIHIDDDYKDDLIGMLDEQQAKVFTGGQIIRLGSDYFYYAFDSKPHGKNITDSVEYNEEKIIHVGLDFNVGKMSATFSHQYDNLKTGKKEQHFYDELFLSGNSDTYMMGDAILARYPIDRVVITCDASGKNRKTTGVSDVLALKSMGFEVRFKRANPKMRQRQLMINGMMDNERIKVNPRCKRLIKDWKKVQQEKSDFSKSKANEDLTHMSDGADYLIDWEYSSEFKEFDRNLRTKNKVA